MPPYTIDRTSNRGRQEVEDWLFGLDQVSAKLRDDIVTAWGRRLRAGPPPRPHVIDFDRLALDRPT